MVTTPIYTPAMTTVPVPVPPKTPAPTKKKGELSNPPQEPFIILVMPLASLHWWLAVRRVVVVWLCERQGKNEEPHWGQDVTAPWGGFPI